MEMVFSTTVAATATTKWAKKTSAMVPSKAATQKASTTVMRPATNATATFKMSKKAATVAAAVAATATTKWAKKSLTMVPSKAATQKAPNPARKPA